MNDEPWRKVIYAKVKPGTTRKYFILLECGHVHHNGDVAQVPKRKRCCYCRWKTKTIDLIFWEHHTIRWAFIKFKNTLDKLGITGQFTE